MSQMPTAFFLKRKREAHVAVAARRGGRAPREPTPGTSKVRREAVDGRVAGGVDDRLSPFHLRVRRPET
jgi:hypothetical protein